MFDIAHRLAGRMIAESRLDGLRLDHIDGLFDPEAYCRRLQAFAEAQQPPGAAPFYIVVEKILARHESPRPGWPIAGTTGYEPLAAAGERADHLVAFARKRGDRRVLVLAGRLFVGLLGWEAARYDGAAWQGASLPLPEDVRGRWRDALTGAVHDFGANATTLPLERLVAVLPAAVLVRVGE